MSTQTGRARRQQSTEPAVPILIAPKSVALTAQVTAPPLPLKYVRRPRLIAAIQRLADVSLLLVSAGPGSGKTSLLAEWAAARSTSTAWLTAEPHDNQPARLWRTVAEALYTVGSVADVEPFTTLPHQDGDHTPFVDAVRAALGGPGARTLIIDDAHLLTNPIILGELDAIIRGCQPYLRLVLATRSDPMLPLHRYRLAGQMAEVRASHLAMSRAEARSLLAEHGVSLAGPDLDALNYRTEGWAAGLRLSAMTMAGSRHPERFVTELALDQGSVGEYLTEEVLARQPATVTQLLVQTSFLDQVSGPLAAAVTGIDSSPELLRDLARANSFVIPLDHDEQWYRYHQLLLEILRYRLRREPIALQRQLRARAAEWFDKNGQTGAALRLAVAAGDFTRASTVLVRGGLVNAFIERDDLFDVQVREIRNVAPAGVPEEELRVANAAVAAMLGEDDAVQQARAALSPPGLSPELRATAGVAALIAAERAGSVDHVDESASQLLADIADQNVATASAEIAELEGLAVAVRVAQARTRFWQNHSTDEVDDLLLQAMDSAAGPPAVQRECLDLLQLTSVLNGRLATARDYDNRSRELDRTADERCPSAVRRLAHGYLAFLRGDLRKAYHVLPREDDNDQRAVAAAALLRAWVTMALGRPADAYQQLRSDSALRGPLPLRLQVAKRASAAELELQLGRPHAALRLLAEHGTDDVDPLIELSVARALLASGGAASAAARMRPLLIELDGRVPLPLLLQLLLLAAAAAEADGDLDGAAAQVGTALELAGEGLAQPFAAARPQLDAVLVRHPHLRAAWPTPLENNDVSPGRPALGNRLAEPLTDREVSVLRRLATTMTTAEISDELYVSINTVKTHIAAIYRKLPASGRRDAVKRARQLELL